MKLLCFFRYGPEKASSRVRGYQLALELEKRNIECTTLTGTRKSSYVRCVREMARHDAVLFQKLYTYPDVLMNTLARSLGRKTIFDIDDAPFGNTYSKRAERLAGAMAGKASAVLAGSHQLKRFAAAHNRNTHLIPSSIDLSLYEPVRRAPAGDRVTLGWIGDGVSYREDLTMLAEPLRRLGERHPVRLVIIGALGQEKIYETFAHLGPVEVRMVDAIDWKDPAAVAAEISRFDIGLYPLTGNVFNIYKCGFKALEYMALKIPVVASPVGENGYIIDDGTEGFLAVDGEQWYRKLRALVENEQTRLSMGEAGRKKVEEKYSLDVTAGKVADIINAL